MVQKALSMVFREVRGLHQAAYILAIFTFFSQLLALVRDRLLAHEFGAGIELDLYYAAFRIPDFLYVMFASMLSVYVLIPFIAKRMEEGPSGGKDLLSQIFSFFFFLYAAIGAVAMMAAPQIVAQFFPGFVAHEEELVLLMRILLVQPLLLGISSLFGVITQMERRFVLYAISPLIYNVGIILGLIFFYPWWGIYGVAAGVVLGALGHVCVQLPFVLRSPLRPRFLFKFNAGEVLEVVRTSFLRALTLSLHQIVLLGLVGFASLMAVGSVSVFQFAFNLQSVPLAIIGVSYSVAAFPLLAQLYADKKFALFAENITTALRHIIFWSLPAIALFVVVRAQFVRVVLGSGEFDWSDTRLTAAVLALFILSLGAQAIHLLLVRALYAVGNTRLPLYVTIFSSLLALFAAFFFYILILGQESVYMFFARLMRLEGVSGLEVLSLPLGYSLALIIHSTCLIIFSRRHLFLSLRALVRPFLTSSIAALIGGYTAYVTLNYFVVGLEPSTLLTVFLHGLIGGFGGLAGVLSAHYLLRSKELFEISAALKKRFGKDNVVVPQDEDTLAV